jgi:hypothetical protein
VIVEYERREKLLTSYVGKGRDFFRLIPGSFNQVVETGRKE